MQIRAFTWSDVETYARLTGEAQRPGPGPGFTAAAAREFLGQPNLHPTRDLFLAELDGHPVGCVLVVPELPIERVIIEGGVVPSYRRRGVGRVLLARGIEHGRTLGARLAHVQTVPPDVEAPRLLKRLSFVEVRRQWQMRLKATDVPAERPAKRDYRVRPLEAGEAHLLTDLQNRAFGGSWGFCPNRPEEIDYRLRMGGGSYRDAIILEMAGRSAAYCWTKMAGSGDARTGIIWMIGSLPEYRGHGLGRAMLLESIVDLRSRGARAVELTVYADNAPAVGLYKAVGFKQIGEIVFWERAL